MSVGLLRVALGKGRRLKGAGLSKGEFCAFSTSDGRALYTLDRQCHLSPWSYEGFISELEQPYTHCWGKRDGKEIVAFVMSHVILDEAHILKIGVAPYARRQGIAGRLLKYAIERFEALKVRESYLEVRESQQGAQQLYEKAGFSRSGIRKNYYGREDGHERESEDAILYRLSM